MIPTHILGTLFALLSAATWGAGDFSGGVAARSRDQYHVVLLMTVPGILILGAIALAMREPFPPQQDMLWAIAAGVSGSFGIASLYRGLSLGNSAIVAPTAAVIGAGLPVAFSSIVMGLPGSQRIFGFLLAIMGIWLVSRQPDGLLEKHRQGLFHAVIAGTSFGGYFILVGQVQQGLVFGPLTVAKIAALITTATIVVSRPTKASGLAWSSLAVVAGVFDAGGNAFYMLAKQYTRLDVAAVLASMYPIITVVLASVFMREKVASSQWVGVVICLAAIAFIVA